MYYYIVNNRIVAQENEMNTSFYTYPQLNTEQIAFYLANPTASVSEVLAMELNPIPTPPEPSNEPTLEERVETNEDALDELIQYVYGGA